MCGIAAGLDEELVAKATEALRHRGPDAMGVRTVNGVTLGHTRLSIMDPTAASNQPFRVNDLRLAYNGEVWNYQELRAAEAAAAHAQGVWPRYATTGDTEVVATLLERDGWAALEDMEGMWGMAWMREGIGSEGMSLFVARDRFGEVPLYFHPHPLIASELKAIKAAGLDPSEAQLLTPGGVAYRVGGRWHSLPYYTPPTRTTDLNLKSAARGLRSRMDAAVAERMMSDVPICTLVSGGIDSAIITMLLAKANPNITAFTAVLDVDSRDARMSRALCKHLGIELIEVPVPVPTAEDLERVVEIIEMPYKAQVEIAWACLHLAAEISERGFKVTYSGEGSDELWASYGMSYHGIEKHGWDMHRRLTFAAQHRKNFPRANKVFMHHGVECRLPFLHRSVVEFALSLPMSAVRSEGNLKGILAEAYRGELPDEILDRPKVAFQTGMGLKDAIAEAMPRKPAQMYRDTYRAMYGPGQLQQVLL